MIHVMLMYRYMLIHVHPSSFYTTKIDEFVCPPYISETVAVRIMKLAHCPRIASTTIKLISKPILLPIFPILLKQFSELALARSANRRRRLFVYGDSTESVGFHYVDNLVLPPGTSICIILFSLLIRPCVLLPRCSYGKLNCDGLYILITLIYIITPLLTSTHKPVLARDPSSFIITARCGLMKSFERPVLAESFVFIEVSRKPGPV